MLNRLGTLPFPALVRETLRSGSIAAIAMIPFGLAFTALGWRVNEYGRAVLKALVGDLPAGLRVVLLLVEHFLISWTACVPLLLLLLATRHMAAGWLVGAAYGAAFYVAMNSLALPWWFGDPTPWQIGWTAVLPSLAVHLVYGLSIAFTARGWVGRAIAGAS
jgi:uncharacterized membrane protein YagU involved in acid resistance